MRKIGDALAGERNHPARNNAVDIGPQRDKIVKNQQLRRDTLSKCVIATQNVY